MSFSAQVKQELCRKDGGCPHCLHAEAYGLLLFGKQFGPDGLQISMEHPEAARRAAQCIAQAAGVMVEVSSRLSRRGKTPGAGLCTVSVEGQDACGQVLSCFGYSGKEAPFLLRTQNFPHACCLAAFLRGAFLSCGSVTHPQKEYHLEFALPRNDLAEGLRQCIASIPDLSIQPSCILRKGSPVVYLKDSEAIADLLTYMGAPGGAMELMQAKMLKEVRNNINRRTNFENANLDKTAAAAARQVIAIETIRDTVGLRELPQELREIAVLRYENPDLSLRELGESLTPPISRSGVNHRLRRILEIAEDLTAEKQNGTEKK